MAYGQVETELPVGDRRGVIPSNEAARVRKIRAEEQWERVDSVVIGKGASTRSRGWFETWPDFAEANELQWFSGRDTAVGPAYTNQQTERTDWAQDIYHISVQMIAPPGIADLETNPNDALIMPLLFQQQLATQLALSVILADSDQVASAPADHFPGGFGTSYPLVSSSATPTTFAGNNGEPVVQNTWKFPEPIMLAAKAKITIRGQIDSPIRGLLAGLTGPGEKNVPTGNPQQPFRKMPNWYTIKITLRGPRYLQLRGARSSA
ncbi:MAG: hypothetical protein B7733_09430 [Myxococcales bacterium FL481]|nr:MAG: hypothetical protein B7733_09430 [Myxococcales bacterium FL481]